MSKFSKFVGNQNSGSPRINEPIPVRVSSEEKATGVKATGVKATGMKATDLDPRPDLAEDHRHWVAVLSLAWYRDRDLWGLLHGLRCGGARLETKRASDGREMFRLDYRPLLDVWSEQELRSQWLEPYREAMKRLFADAPELMQSVEAEFAKMAG